MKNQRHLELIALSTLSIFLISYAGFHFSAGPSKNKTTVPHREFQSIPTAKVDHSQDSILLTNHSVTRANKPSAELLAAATSAFAERAAESLVFDPESSESNTETPRFVPSNLDPLELEEEAVHKASVETGDPNHQINHDTHLAVEAPEEFVLALQKH